MGGLELEGYLFRYIYHSSLARLASKRLGFRKVRDPRILITIHVSAVIYKV